MHVFKILFLIVIFLWAGSRPAEAEDWIKKAGEVVGGFTSPGGMGAIEEKACSGPIGGRCGVCGGADFNIATLTAGPLRFEARQEGGLHEWVTLAAGQRARVPMCNRLLVSVRVHPEERCGSGELYETRQIRIYGGDTVEFRRDKVVFKNADRLKWASGAAGIAVMAVAQAYGIPPQALAVAGVEEAKIYTSCMSAFDTDVSSLASQAGQSAAESGDVQGALGNLGPMGCLKKIWNYIPKEWKTKFRANSCAAERLARAGITPGGGDSFAGTGAATGTGMSAEQIELENKKLQLEQLKIQNDFALGQKKYQLEKAKAEADAALRAQELSIEAKYKQGLISNEARRIELQNARETYRLKTERIRAIEMGLIGQIQAGNQAAAIANDAAGMNLIDHQIDSFSDADTNRLYEMQLNR